MNILFQILNSKTIITQQLYNQLALVSLTSIQQDGNQDLRVVIVTYIRGYIRDLRERL